MTARLIWLLAILIILTAWAVYRVAPGGSVLIGILGVFALVVIGDRMEMREREAEVEAKRERLREAARRHV